MTVDLGPEEQLIAGWKVVLRPRSLLGAVVGNLLLSEERLIFEPYGSNRTGHAPRAVKAVINGAARLAERVAPPFPFTVPLAELSVIERTGTQGMPTLSLTDRWGNTSEFLFSATRSPVGVQHRLSRDEAAQRIGLAVRLR